MWAFVGTLHYGFFVWSTQHVETAVATTVYETWPFFLILFLIRYDAMDEALRLRQPYQRRRRLGMRAGELPILAMSAAVGIVLISLSRHANLPVDLASWNYTAGIVLAAVAALLHALWIAGTLILGRAIYYRFVEAGQPDSERVRDWSELPVHDRSKDHKRLLLWFTVAGIVVARVVALPATMALGFLFQAEQGTSIGSALTFQNFSGAILLGTVGALSAILRRYGDISTTGPGVHALAFLTPPLSLLMLWGLGFDLPRKDLFIVGAALIVASNILIQVRPDQHRDLLELDIDENPSRGRMGFNAFVLSIWTLGSLIYARDEIMPRAWLEWRLGEYWGLVALSATIFALVLGFRVVRLNGRIDQEDEIAVRLFRGCEHLVRRGCLAPESLAHLRVLDMTRTRHFIDAYTSLRLEIRHQMDARSDTDEYIVLRDVEIDLDRLCHIKQQGKDIVELISLSAFALVTMSIVVFARPAGFLGVKSEWASFVSESFALILVSTVAFLWLNLFDMERDREVPTLVPIRQHGGDYGVLFRYNRDLRVKHIAAVLLSAAMVAVFLLLLYDKWLNLEGICGSIYRHC